MARAVAAAIGEKIDAGFLAQLAELPAARPEPALDELEWPRCLNADPLGYSFVAQIARQVVDRDMITGGRRERVLSRWKELRSASCSIAPGSPRTD